MRRFFLPLVLGALVAAVFAAPGLAKETNVELAAAPRGIDAGTPWNAVITVTDHGQPVTGAPAPTLILRDQTSGDELSRTAEPTGKPGEYVARVKVPHAGLWSPAVRNGITGRTYEYPMFTGEPRAAAPADTTAKDPSSFPMWPIVTALALLVGAAALVLVVRRARPGKLEAPEAA